MKRAQSEVVGLLVIVVILIFMGVIYLGFANLAGNGSLSSQRAGMETENALNALVRVNLEEYDGKTVQDLVVEGANRIDCDTLGYALNEVYGAILRPGTDFSFWAKMEEEEIYSVGVCSIGVVSSYVFVRDGNYYELRLRLCNE